MKAIQQIPPASLLIAFLGLAQGCSTTESQLESAKASDTVLSQDVYLDPKGFFQIRPPDGWLIHEYSSDPRGKVDFNSSSSNPKAQLKIFGAASPYSGFDDLLAYCQGASERIRTQVRGTVTVNAVTYFNTRAVEVVIDAPGRFKQKQLHVLFGKNHYTFAFIAPLNTFDAYYALVKKSMETFEPLFKELTDAHVIEHFLASKIRRAELYLSVGRADWALVVIEEGLRLDKNNTKLLELKQRCRQ